MNRIVLTRYRLR